MVGTKSWRDGMVSWIMIGVHVNGLIIVQYMPRISTTESYMFWMLGVACSQAALLSIWVVFGSQKLALRVAVFLLAMPGIWLILTEGVLRDDEHLLSLALMIGLAMMTQATLLFTTFGFLRSARRVFRRQSAARPTIARGQEEFQFSIRWLFAYTAAVAVMLTIGRAILPHNGWKDALPELREIRDVISFLGIFVLPMVLSDAISFWTIVPGKIDAKRVVLTTVFFGCVVATPSILFFAFALFQDLQFIRDFALMNSIHFLSLVVSLYVLRRTGWMQVAEQLETEVKP